MASPVNISQRLQALENLLEALTSEFRQLRQELEVMQIASNSEQESVSQQPLKRFEADKETTISAAFFSVDSMEIETQQSPSKGFEADKATMLSESWFEEDTREIASEPKRGFEADKATMLSESWFEEDAREIACEPKRGFEADKATMLSDDLIYEELTDPDEWDPLRQELEPGKETIAFDFPIEAPKAAQPPKQNQPAPKNLPDPW